MYSRNLQFQFCGDLFAFKPNISLMSCIKDEDTFWKFIFERNRYLIKLCYLFLNA